MKASAAKLMKSATSTAELQSVHGDVFNRGRAFARTFSHFSRACWLSAYTAYGNAGYGLMVLLVLFFVPMLHAVTSELSDLKSGSDGIINVVVPRPSRCKGRSVSLTCRCVAFLHVRIYGPDKAMVEFVSGASR